MGFPGGSLLENSDVSAGDMGSVSGREDLLEEEMASYSSILVRRSP